MNLFSTFFWLSLFGTLLAAGLGIGLGAYLGASTKPLVRAAGLPASAGIGIGAGLVAAIGTGALVLGVIFLKLLNLPVGSLAAGLAFGLVIALVTVDWAGTALAAGFVGIYTATAIASAFGLFSLLRFLPEFLSRFILPYIGQIVTSLGGLAALLIVGFVAALVSRLVNQYVTEGSTTPPTTSI